MKTKLSWLNKKGPGRLAVAARPRGGDWIEDEIQAWKGEGVDVVVSLLTNDEILTLNLEEEPALCRANGLDFMSFSIPDREVPQNRKTAVDVLRVLDKRLLEGKRIVVHCRQGIGRSPLIAASLLVMSGDEPESAFGHIGSVLGYQVPETQEQREWLQVFANSLSALAKK